MRAVQQLAVDDDRAADTGAENDCHTVADILQITEAQFCQCRGLGVVADGDRHAEGFRKLRCQSDLADPFIGTPGIGETFDPVDDARHGNAHSLNTFTMFSYDFAEIFLEVFITRCAGIHFAMGKKIHVLINDTVLDGSAAEINCEILFHYAVISVSIVNLIIPVFCLILVEKGAFRLPVNNDYSASISARTSLKHLTAKSISSFVWLAQTWVRIRALPFGTTG